MRSIFTLLAFLAWAVVLSWLITRAPSKWGYVVLVGLVVIALVFGLGYGLSNSIPLFLSASNPAAIDGSTTKEQVVRIRELISFCNGCHATNDNLTVAQDFPAAGSAPSLVMMPSDIVDDSGVDSQELLAYEKTSAPDLEGVVSNWSETDFMQTIHTGRDPRGHSLAYGMPWHDIAVIAPDGDLASYYIYLHGLMLTK